MALSDVYWDHQIPLPKLPPAQAKVTVALVALLCFINSYDGEFVFDDSEAIVNNKVRFLWHGGACVLQKFYILWHCFGQINALMNTCVSVAGLETNNTPEQHLEQ